MRGGATVGLEHHCPEFAVPQVHDTRIPKGHVQALSVDDDCRVNDALSAIVNTIIHNALATYGPPIVKIGIDVSPSSIK
jgi:hypothetical protein